MSLWKHFLQGTYEKAKQDQLAVQKRKNVIKPNAESAKVTHNLKVEKRLSKSPSILSRFSLGRH